MLERPFHFVIVLWGERFRDYFLEFCLASLLAEGNVPSLKTKIRSKLVLATTRADWDAMSGTEIFRIASKYLDPFFIEIEPCPPEKSGCEHMGTGHKPACELAYLERAYTVHLTPDCVLSAGTVLRLQELASKGVEVVLAAALRFGEEPFMHDLSNAGLLGDGWRQHSGEALKLSGRNLVHAAVNGMHSETLTYEWEAPWFSTYPSAAWWKVPGDEGIIVHSFSWAPLLLDYAIVIKHDTSMLDYWTIDGDYVNRNFGLSDAVYVVQDSDEIFHASWAPLDDRPRELVANPFTGSAWFGRLAKGALFRHAYMLESIDLLKRSLFLIPVRWHIGPVGEKWKATEAAVAETIRRYVSPPLPTQKLILSTAALTPGNEPGKVTLPSVLRMRMLDLLAIALHFELMLRAAWAKREVNGHRILKAMSGDPVAMRWVFWRIKKIGYDLSGRQLKTQAPMPPPLD